MSVRRHVGGTLATAVGIQVVGLVTGIVVARLLGVEGRGELVAVTLVPSIIVYLGDLGIPLAYVYYAARERGSSAALFGNALVLTLVQWAVLSLAGSVVVALALTRFDTSIVTVALLFLVAYLPLNLLMRYGNAINHGREAFGRFNLARWSIPVSYAVLLGALAAAGAGSVAWVVGATLASNVVGIAIALPPVVRAWRAAPRDRRTDRALVRRTWSYGLRAHVGNLTPLDSLQLDLLLVTLVLGAYDAGLYAVALAAGMVVRAQGYALGLVALPAAAREGSRGAVASIFRLTLLLNVVTAAAIALAAGWALPLIYGDGFAGGVTAARILAIALVAASLRRVLADVLRGAGRPGRATLAEAASWPVAVVALAVLLPLYGIAGAALAAGASYGASLLLSLRYVRELGIPLRALFMPTREDAALAGSFLRRPRTPGRPVVGEAA